MRSRDTFLNAFPSLLPHLAQFHSSLMSGPSLLLLTHSTWHGLRADFLIVMYRIWHHHIDTVGRLSLYYWIPVVIIIYCFARHKHHYTTASSYIHAPLGLVAGVCAAGGSKKSPRVLRKNVFCGDEKDAITCSSTYIGRYIIYLFTIYIQCNKSTQPFNLGNRIYLCMCAGTERRKA